ncbi:MAG TPA: hypothetical protein VMW50_03455 [Dehalococcoidia bacterium]|nr:hypothetical protein [Dehalococcoidia bacterium]
MTTKKVVSVKFSEKRKINELRHQLRARKEEYEYLIYQQLAKIDPSIKALMSELYDLDPEACLMIEAPKKGIK